MVTYIGLNWENTTQSLMLAFAQLAFCYNHGGRVVVFSDCLSNVECKFFIDNTDTQLRVLSAQPYQFFTYLNTSEFYEMDNLLNDMEDKYCKPDICLIHVDSRKKVAHKFFEQLEDIVYSFPETIFLVTYDNDWLNANIGK